MADERIANKQVLVNPTTTSQELLITAAGRAPVDIGASITLVVDTELAAASALSDDFANPTTPVVGAALMGFDGTTWDRIYAVADGATVAAGTKGFLILGTDGTNYQVLKTDSTGSLQVDIESSATITVDTELPAAAALSDNFANPTAPGVGAFEMLWDGATWDRAPGTSVDGALVNLGANNDVTVTGAVDTELPAAAALADNAANPTTPTIGAALLGYDGTTWDRVYTVADGDAVAAGTKGFLLLGTDGANYQVLKTDASGELQVDVLTGGGSDTPTGATTNLANSTDTAAGSSSNLDTAEITEAERLAKCIVTGSVAFKGVIQRVENGSATAMGTVFGRAGETVEWVPPHRLYGAHAGASAGLDVFRVVATNLDTSQAADLYASFYYQNN
jgi:hypothetical protein